MVISIEVKDVLASTDPNAKKRRVRIRKIRLSLLWSPLSSRFFPTAVEQTLVRTHILTTAKKKWSAMKRKKSAKFLRNLRRFRPTMKVLYGCHLYIPQKASGGAAEGRGAETHATGATSKGETSAKTASERNRWNKFEDSARGTEADGDTAETGKHSIDRWIIRENEGKALLWYLQGW